VSTLTSPGTDRPRTSEDPRWVLPFAEGSADQKYLLGGKGANLAEMVGLELPVPPGFVISTEGCRAYLEAGEKLPDGLLDEAWEHLDRLENAMGRRLGDPEDPLLVSVRSGAPVSMPLAARRHGGAAA
jgi:pyruvate, orthophosphate dikinase